MNEPLYAEMFAMEQAHWWFRGKHQIVMNLLERYLPRDESGRAAFAKPRVADLGCGCGMMPYKLKDRYDVVGMDMSDDAIAFAAQRGVKVEKGGLPDSIPFAENSFDAVLMLDVLEHLEQDGPSAIAASKLLKPGGVFIGTVPAYQWLYSQRDADHQHFRRYAKRPYRTLFEDAGLKIELISHYNFWLFPLAVMARLASKVVKPKPGHGDLKLPPKPINETMRWIFAFERHLLGRVTLPWGLSLISVARRV